jgi:hypothetical protein
MNEIEILSIFASNFVRKAFRERFIHEAIKKPKDLHRRICHEISKVFDEEYKGQPIPLKGSDDCLFLGWFSPIAPMSWEEAKKRMASGGGGYLVIKSDGTAFYAETEAYPATVYAGNI